MRSDLKSRLTRLKACLACLAILLVLAYTQHQDEADEVAVQAQGDHVEWIDLEKIADGMTIVRRK